MRKLLVFHRKLSVRLRGFYLRWLIRLCGGQCGKGLLVDGRVLFKYPPHAGIRIGSNVSIGKNTVIDVPEYGSLEVGDRVKLNMDIVIAAQERIRIGADTLIGEFVSLRDADHGMNVSAGVMQAQPMIASPIEIGPDVWIARGVIIMRGVSVGAGAVIAANAVVRTDVGARQVFAGVPARFVKNR